MRILISAAAMGIAVAVFITAGVVGVTLADNNQTNEKNLNYVNIDFQTITGDTTNLAASKGKVVLIVNVASKCGYTPQYAGLEALYRTYQSRDFIVIGFPANNFGGQEPGTNAQILDFCRTKYDVTFPMMSKISVKGNDIHPLYRYLTETSPFPGVISWNFNKFLLDRNGNVAARYSNKTKPDDEDLISKLEELLGK